MIPAAWVATGCHGPYITQGDVPLTGCPSGWTARGWRRALAEGARRVRAWRRPGDHRTIVVIHLDGVDWLPATHGREGPSKLFGVAL